VDISTNHKASEILYL